MDPAEIAAFAQGKEHAYIFIGRENQDRTIRYLLGRLKKDADKPKFKETDLIQQQGLWSRSREREYLLFEPGEEPNFQSTPIGKLFSICTWNAGGYESLQDATKRGVSRIPVPPPFAAVRMHGGAACVTEYIPLTDEQVKAFKQGKKIKNPGGNDYTIGYSLVEVDEYDLVEYEKGGVPKELLRLAIDKCGYEPPFALPKAAPVKASLTLNHSTYGDALYTQTLDDAKSLKKLDSILRTMKRDSEGKCGYYSKLVLSYKNGEERVFVKGIDGCGSFIMGSGAARQISQKADKAFWKLFSEIRETEIPPISP